MGAGHTFAIGSTMFNAFYTTTFSSRFTRTNGILKENNHIALEPEYKQVLSYLLRMVYSLVVRAVGLEYGGREFKSRSLHLKPETKTSWGKGAFWLSKGS